MDEFLKLIAGNPQLAMISIVSLGIALASVSLIYLIAFLQGREVSFWPPKIGARPERGQSAFDSARDAQPNPIIQRGSLLKAASGSTFTIESNFYGGATATLFQATNSAKEKIIVKVYWRGLMPNSTPWEFFSREFRTAELLVHRNIVKVLDKGLFGGYPFIAMEYLPGGTLRDLLQAREHIPGSDILSIASQVADAIDFAHSRGIVHRDIKPGNILFESDSHGRVALSDFGVAAWLGAVERDITAQGNEFVGTPAYLAPEAIMGQEIAQASDIYGFGVVLFEMIAGRIPFDEYQQVYAIVQAKMFQDAPDIRDFREVPEQISKRLAKTLSRKPKERPTSARKVLSGIENLISQL